ncbi:MULTISPECIES: YbjN domain-containing protein [unclassified Ectothiorhodospira]|jgi:hypothetical protein|uniref:YbjN domain-containing protein n=1 Tax=unclassified Ectothiorhodospira TaxID=2684909 RepID=UPI001EE870B4|nr:MULTISPECIES: YbjN domain-containing protein [unclassified Ectothiorhodospira]MCG5517260.1 YbjN domain-containing protein [Ectothiorhodospira sp. 9100]MCG5519450.1 YbjN domain-containing protein [Ectothiorhodospira sp. 9905]
MFKSVLVGGFLALAVNSAGAADLVDATDPEQILNLARGYGSATLDTDGVGDPMITGRMDGTRYSIMFFGCSNNRNCKTLRFSTAWATDGEYTLADMNDWNESYRFGKAYLDDDGDPVLEMNVNMLYGVSRGNLDDTIDWWRVALTQFKSEVLNQ